MLGLVVLAGTGVVGLQSDGHVFVADALRAAAARVVGRVRDGGRAVAGVEGNMLRGVVVGGRDGVLEWMSIKRGGVDDESHAGEVWLADLVRRR